MPMDDGEASPSKFVIRNLPPNLCEADFHKMLTDVCQDELEWFRFHPGSFTSTGIRTSTAFIKLKHPQLAPILSQVLQQTPFSGEHGVLYHSEMAVALFQKVPKEREKQDPYLGTYKEDPFFQKFVKELEEEDEETTKGPLITATTTIPEQPPKETIVTPLMQHIIDAHTPKVSSGRRQRVSSGGGGRTNTQDSTHEKENQKKHVLTSISEGTTTDGKANPSSRQDGKRVRERKSGKDPAGGAVASKAHLDPAPAIIQRKAKGSSSFTDFDTTARSAKRDNKRESSKPKPEKKDKNSEGQVSGGSQSSRPVVPDVGDLVAAQAVARAAAKLVVGVPSTVPDAGSDTTKLSSLSGAPVPKNGTTATPPGAAKAENGEGKLSGKGKVQDAASRRPRSGRNKRGGNRSVLDKSDSKDLSKPRTSDALSNSTSTSTPTAAERMAKAAAAAAAAALADAAGKPVRRPALQSRGVRDALSRAGIQKSAILDTKAPESADNGT